MIDSNCYSDKVIPLTQILSGLKSIRLTRQNKFKGAIFWSDNKEIPEDFISKNQSCEKLFFDAAVV